MQDRVKNYGLVICLFVFLFVIIGGGLHLAPGGAFLAAVTGTPLAIYAFRTKFGPPPTYHNCERDFPRNEVQYASSTANNPD